MTSVLTDLGAACRNGLLAGAAAVVLLLPTGSPSELHAAPAAATLLGELAPGQVLRRADFGAWDASRDAREVADWIAEAGDNGASFFIIVDKPNAVLHVFDADARRTTSTAVLLGASRGDDSVPGIGTRSMASIQVSERTTPAGRFVGERGHNESGEDVIWVDYDAAVSMHRVRLNNPAEHRAERLASPSADDNRISYGCINVPAAFYDEHIRPIFARRRAVVYVLPDVKSVREVFASFAVQARPSSTEIAGRIDRPTERAAGH